MTDPPMADSPMADPPADPPTAGSHTDQQADHPQPTDPQVAAGRSAALVSFERMLATGKDSALLRFSIGNEHAKVGDWAAAADALAQAVAMDSRFTAAWKLYARALLETGRPREALDAYRTGIDVANQTGDRQAEKEMTVFARRIERALADVGQRG
jgi:tetratricopeptide (TPR) repeat protein